jgi:hypothetical protein
MSLGNLRFLRRYMANYVSYSNKGSLARYKSWNSLSFSLEYQDQLLPTTDQMRNWEMG